MKKNILLILAFVAVSLTDMVFFKGDMASSITGEEQLFGGFMDTASFWRMAR